jgi:hypothetical protein
MLRPLPFRDAEQLVQIWERQPSGSDLFPTGLAFKYWRNESTKLDHISIADPVFRAFTGAGVAERDRSLDVLSVTDFIQGDFFRAMGIPLRQGRQLTAQDHDSAAPRVAVINETLARTLFGDQDPIGRRLITGGKTGRSWAWSVTF